MKISSVAILAVACGGSAAAPVVPSDVVVGPGGGVVHSGALTLTIPPGALASSVTIKAAAIASPDFNDPLGVSDRVYRVEPADAVLALPVTVSIALPGSAVPDGLPDGFLRLYRLAGDWELVDSTASAASVDGAINSFGTFAARLWAAAGSCAGPEYRSFDFWVGGWSIDDRAQPGANQASSDISFDTSGCYILEHYRQANYDGRSVSFYNPSTHTWHQTYRDTTPVPEKLAGSGGSGTMQLDGFAGNVALHVTYTRIDADHVHHVSAQERNGIEHVTFDGHYSRSH